MEISKCKFCGKMPILKVVSGDLYYVHCGCKNWDVHQFLGLNANAAFQQWNTYNDKILFKEFKKSLKEG